MGLREDKKERLRREIVDRATELFRERGFEHTRVREISARCEISDATFFNYFPTKDAVLTAWTQAQIASAFDAVIEPGSDRGARRILRRLTAELARRTLSDRELAAAAWGRARGPAPRSSALVELIRHAQDREELRRDLSAEQLSMITLAVATATLTAWLARAEAGEPQEALESALRAAVDLVLDGARRRNERVRARSGAASRVSDSLSTR